VTARLIPPHGGKLVTRTGERPDGVEALEQITLSGRELADLDMLASGALSPLRGFMGRADYEGVVEGMQLADGTIWALPVTLAVAEAPRGERIALAGEDGTLLGVLEIASRSTRSRRARRSPSAAGSASWGFRRATRSTARTST
jgi:sulfate adenylyltransferase